MKILLATIGILFINSVIGQNAPITTAGSTGVCTGDTIPIPITVSNFSQITAISLQLEFNPSKLDYISYSELNSSLSGCIVNEVTVSNTLSRIMIVWSDVSPLSLPDDSKIVDLNFKLSTSSALISFNNTINGGGNCEYADLNGDPLNDLPTSTYYINSLVSNTDVGAAGTIVGSDSVNQGQGAVIYSVPIIANAENYLWDYSGVGVTISGNSDTVTVIFSDTATSGNLSVMGSNYCGVGPVSPYHSIVVNSLTQQSIPLSAGWNILSFNVIPDTLDMINIFEPIIDSGYLVKVIDEAGGFIQYIPDFGWLNTIGEMANTEGYYIKVTTTSTFEIKGYPITSPFDIGLNTGWNIIGYPLFAEQDALSVLQPLIDASVLVKAIDQSGGFIQYIPVLGWLNTIGNFVPGEGYYIKVNTNHILTFQEEEVNMQMMTRSTASLTNHYKTPYNGNPFSPMHIIITEINGINLEVGDEIAVYDGDILVGATIIDENYGVITIISAQDDPTTAEKDGFTKGNPLDFRVFKNEDKREYVITNTKYIGGQENFEPLGTWVGEITFDIMTISESQIPEENFLDQNFPNPSNHLTTIKYGLKDESQVKLDIYSTTGIYITNLITQQQKAGTYQTEFNTQNLTAGIYIYKIQVISKDNIWLESKQFVVK